MTLQIILLPYKNKGISLEYLDSCARVNVTHVGTQYSSLPFKYAPI
jgi:hypothetical protein